jgi:4-amino-4-deoxy-L-arabinose transferase-like glycosyltransferase
MSSGASRPLFAAVLILLFALILFALPAGRRPVTGILEERVAITSREMWRAGEWILPTMNGEPRLQKPPFAYWIVEGFANIRGAFDDWTLRLPFATLAAGTALLVWAIGRSEGGPALGLVAAIVLLTSSLFIAESHRATADPAQLFCAAGAWLFYLRERAAAYTASNEQEGGIRRRLRRWRRVGFYFFLGLGALAKGPVILLLCVAPPFVEALVRRSRTPLRPLASPVGIAIFLVLALAWPIAVARRLDAIRAGAPVAANPQATAPPTVDGQPVGPVRQWFLESFGKILPTAGEEAGYRFQRHGEPWHFYLPRLLSTLGLWCPALAGALFMRSAGGRFRAPLWTAFVTIFVAFSCFTEKKLAYLLPLVVPGALLAAGAIVNGYASYRGVLERILRPVVWIVPVLFLLGAAAVLAPQWSGERISALAGAGARVAWDAVVRSPLEPLLLGVAVSAAIVALGIGLRRHAQALPPFLAFGAALVLATALYERLLERIPSEEGDPRLAAQRGAAQLDPGVEVFCLGSRAMGAVGSLPGGLVYYLDRKVRLVPDDELATLASLPEGAAVLIVESRAQKLAAGGVAPDAKAAPKNESFRVEVGKDLPAPLDGLRARDVLNPEAASPRDRAVLLTKIR